jgi:hypothetical protein
MIHPDTVVRTVNPVIGNGVFATKAIPRGTIVVSKDRYDISLSREEFFGLPETMRTVMETYLYHDREGRLYLSWDHAKYMNHSCNSNTMMTDYDLEIAVRDILPGEEITTEYGLLNIQEPYKIECGCVNCRGHLRLDDLDCYRESWDRQIKESLLLSGQIPQPLWETMKPEARARLVALRDNPDLYSSVKNLKWRLPGES